MLSWKSYTLAIKSARKIQSAFRGCRVRKMVDAIKQTTSFSMPQFEGPPPAVVDIVESDDQYDADPGAAEENIGDECANDAGKVKSEEAKMEDEDVEIETPSSAMIAKKAALDALYEFKCQENNSSIALADVKTAFENAMRHKENAGEPDFLLALAEVQAYDGNVERGAQICGMLIKSRPSGICMMRVLMKAAECLFAMRRCVEARNYLVHACDAPPAPFQAYQLYCVVAFMLASAKDEMFHSQAAELLRLAYGALPRKQRALYGSFSTWISSMTVDWGVPLVQMLRREGYAIFASCCETIVQRTAS